MKWISCLLPLVALLSALQARAAGTVYQWVDRAGVTHFSEVPPAQAETDVAQFEIEPPPPPSADDDYYSVINQAARMEQRRLQIEALRARADADRARAAAAHAATAQAARNASGSPPSESVYLPAFRYYAYPYRPWQPRHRAEHHAGPGRPAYDTGPWPVQSLKPPGPRPYRLR